MSYFRRTMFRIFFAVLLNKSVPMPMEKIYLYTVRKAFYIDLRFYSKKGFFLLSVSEFPKKILFIYEDYKIFYTYGDMYEDKYAGIILY